MLQEDGINTRYAALSGAHSCTPDFPEPSVALPSTMYVNPSWDAGTKILIKHFLFYRNACSWLLDGFGSFKSLARVCAVCTYVVANKLVIYSSRYVQNYTRSSRLS